MLREKDDGGEGEDQFPEKSPPAGCAYCAYASLTSVANMQSDDSDDDDMNAGSASLLTKDTDETLSSPSRPAKRQKTTTSSPLQKAPSTPQTDTLTDTPGRVSRRKKTMSVRAMQVAQGEAPRRSSRDSHDALSLSLTLNLVYARARTAAVDKKEASTAAAATPPQRKPKSSIASSSRSSSTKHIPSRPNDPNVRVDDIPEKFKSLSAAKCSTERIVTVRVIANGTYVSRASSTASRASTSRSQAKVKKVSMLCLRRHGAKRQAEKARLRGIDPRYLLPRSERSEPRFAPRTLSNVIKTSLQARCFDLEWDGPSQKPQSAAKKRPKKEKEEAKVVERKAELEQEQVESEPEEEVR